MIHRFYLKCFHAFCLLASTFLILGCETDVVYTTEVVTYTQTNFDACDIEQCPELNIQITNMTAPADVALVVNPWISENVIHMIYRDAALNPTTIEEAISYYINDSQTAYPEDSVHSETHELTIEVGPSFASNNVLSVVFYGHKFDGGAHGFSVEKYLNINPRTAAIYTMEELVDTTFYAFAKADYEKKTANESYLFILAEPELAAIGFNEEGLLLSFAEVDDPSMKGTVVFHPMSWQDAAPYMKVKVL